MIDMQGGLELAIGNGARPFKYKIEIIFPESVQKTLDFLDSSKVNTLCKATTIPGARITQRGFHHYGHLINLPSTKQYDNEWTATFYLDDSYTIRNKIEAWLGAIDSYLGQTASEIRSQESSLINDALNFATNGLLSAIDATTLLFGQVNEQTNTQTIAGQFGDVDDAKKSITNKVQAIKGYVEPKLESKSSIYGEIKITQLSLNNDTEIISYILYDAYPLYLQPIQFDDTRVDSILDFNVSFSFSRYEIKKGNSIIDKISNVASTVKSFL